MIRNLIIVSVLLFQGSDFVAGQQQASVRKLISSCRSESTDEIIQCAKTQFNKIGGSLIKNGDPDVNLPSLEPLNIDQLKFDEGEGSVKVSAVFTDVKMGGLSSFEIKELNVDYPSKTIRLIFSLPEVTFDADYELKGTVFILPLAGVGTGWVKAENVIITMEASMEVVNNRLVFDYTLLDFKYGKAAIRLDNLFNNDAVLGQTINIFLNENADAIVEEMKGQIIETLSKEFLKVQNEIFQNIDASKIPGIEKLM